MGYDYEYDRDCLEPVAKAIAHCEWFGVELVNGAPAVRAEFREISNDMVSLRDKLHEWLRNHPRPVAKTATDYWQALCPRCGWAGLTSEAEGGVEQGPSGDYSEVRCPVCWHEVDEDERIGAKNEDQQ